MYLTNSDGSLRLDKLGRRQPVHKYRNVKHNRIALYTKEINIRVDEEMYNAIKAIPRGKRAHELRAWIEWGLENDKIGDKS